MAHGVPPQSVLTPENDPDFFHALVDQAPMGIFVQTEGRFAYVNPAGCALFGAATADELVGQPVLERFAPSSRERVLERIRRLNESRERVEIVEQEFLRLDGMPGVCQTSALPFVYQGKNGALVFAQDQTQQKRDQEAAKARDELLHLTGRLAKVGGWEFDARTLKGTWTEEVARIHDLDPALPTDVALGMSFYTASSRRRIEEAVQRALAEAKPYDLELEMVTAAGQRKWVRSKGFPETLDGRVVRVRGIFQDITETRRAQMLLEQEKERLAVTLRSIGDGVVTTDTKGRVTLLNPVAEELTGWTDTEAAGRPLREIFRIVNELTREPCEDPVEKVLRTGSVVELANHTNLLSRDGRELSIADSGAPILDREGRILGVVLVFRDVTEKHKLAEALHRAQNLEAIGVLAGGIAHDFNNLLTGIFGNLSLAQASAESGDTLGLQRNLSRALGIFGRAKALTQQLLTFSKGGSPVREVHPMAPLVQKSASFALSGSNVSLRLELAPDLWACDCDSNQIGQVIDNLVINAQQAMAQGGVVEVSACNVVLDSSPHEERRGRFVRIRVRDHGPGIPKEILPRIFDPFFSTKPTGHGLGLATVHSIVQRHDGWVEVQSELGEGAVFDIHLPAHAAAMSGDADSEGSAASRITLSHRILVMDDEMYLADLAVALLESLGHQAVAVPDGRSALEAFLQAERNEDPFSLCILDLTIPGGMGGVETAQAMRAVRPEARIVAASGYSDDPVIANPSGHGFLDSLRKPYLRKDLVRLLDRVLPD